MPRARGLAWGSAVVLVATGVAYVALLALSSDRPHQHSQPAGWSYANATRANTWQDISVFRYDAHRTMASNVAHKALWPLNVRDVFMIGIAFVSIFVAAGGGIGGGGVLVPLYILVGDFSTRQSVALSNMTILGGALANLVCNINRKHPRANRSLIDWDLILVMEPATIVGALLGGYLNKLLPVWLTTTLLVLLLTAMTIKLVTKGLKTYHIETELQHAGETLLHDSERLNQRHITANGVVHAAANGGSGLREPLLAGGGGDEGAAHEQVPAGTAEGNERRGLQQVVVAQQEGSREQPCSSSDEEELQELLQLESVQVPLMKVAVLVGVSAWVVVSDSLKEAVPCGSLRYWGLVLSLLPCIAVVTVEMRRHLLWKGHVKAAAGHLRADEELNWTPVTTLLYPAISSLAGVIAGLFGVGGGIVKGPLMLELGVSPDVAAATAATMIFFTAGAACIIFIHFGGILWDYAGLMMALGFFVTLAGQLATYQLVQRLGRRSPIIFMMGGLMAMATTVMYYQTAATWVDLAHHPAQFSKTGHICPPGHIKAASHLAALLQ